MLVLREGERKKFFFEKKNQKTFAPGGMGGSNTSVSGQKFFAELFYKKATACLPFLQAFTP
jgi:hypothetical protein